MWSLFYLVVRARVRLLARSGRPDRDDGATDLEILVLRHQLRVLQRTAGRPKLRSIDRVLLAAASRAIPRDRWVAFLVTPSTLLRWHRELIRRKWTYRPTGRRGRPPIDAEPRALILRPARENPRWGCVRVQGELRKLGLRASAMTVRTLLRTARLGPVPRLTGPTWTEFLRAQADGIIACDFFTVETAWLRTLYVLVFIELGSRRFHVGPATVHPDSAWVTRQARNPAMNLDGRSPAMRFLIRDLDAHLGGGGSLIEQLRINADHYSRRRPHRALGLAPHIAAPGEPIPRRPKQCPPAGPARWARPRVPGRRRVIESGSLIPTRCLLACTPSAWPRLEPRVRCAFEGGPTSVMEAGAAAGSR
jgi:hypothetical protein